MHIEGQFIPIGSHVSCEIIPNEHTMVQTIFKCILVHVHICFSEWPNFAGDNLPTRGGGLNANNMYTFCFHITPKKIIFSSLLQAFFLYHLLETKIEESMHMGDHDTSNITRKYTIYYKVHIDD